MRIIAMPAYFWPHTGGIETITDALCKEWAAKGHKATVLTSHTPHTKTYEEHNGFSIIRTGKKTIAGCPFSPGVILRIAKLMPDILYLHYPHPLFLDCSVLGAILAKVPYVLHVHGPEITYDDWKQFPISVYNKTGFRFALEHAAAIVSHTNAAIHTSPFLQQYKHKMTIIPHGTELPPKIHMAKKGKYVLYLGMLRDYKRIDLLLRAFLFVAKQTRAELLIVGDGPLRQELENLSQELSLQNKVRFVGRCTEEEKWAYYQNASIFVLPSPTLMESFGTVALEAAASKKPVIVSGAGVAEVFTKEGIGIVLEPYNVQALADALIDLINHPTKAKRIGASAAAVIKKKYQWKHIAPQYLALFEQVLYDNKH